MKFQKTVISLCSVVGAVTAGQLVSCNSRGLDESPNQSSKLSSVTIGKFDTKGEPEWSSMLLKVTEQGAADPITISKEFTIDDFSSGSPSVSTDITYGDYMILLEYSGNDGVNGEKVLYRSCDDELKKIHKINSPQYSPDITICDAKDNVVGQVEQVAKLVINPIFKESDKITTSAVEEEKKELAGLKISEKKECDKVANVKTMKKSDGSFVITYEGFNTDALAKKTINRCKLFLDLEIPKDKCLYEDITIDVKVGWLSEDNKEEESYLILSNLSFLDTKTKKETPGEYLEGEAGESYTKEWKNANHSHSFMKSDYSKMSGFNTTQAVLLQELAITTQFINYKAKIKQTTISPLYIKDCDE